MDESSPFRGLEPVGLWRHFEAITRIPRPSRIEDQIAGYIRSWAAEHGYTTRSDAVGNLCVLVPASRGREAVAPVVLQSHLDMVCERNANSPYDAEQGRIHVVRLGEFLRAEGTTLGADNGIGVAAMLHVGEAEGIVRGPLELLFTVDEESGLTGAKGLDPTLVRGRTLLNLDSEDDGVLFVGCAGAADTQFLWKAPVQPIPAGWKGVTVAVSGLQGGHSGVDIHKNRLNAIRATVRLLQRARERLPLMLIDLNGGNKRNAIPRECQAKVVYPLGGEGALRQAVDQAVGALGTQYRGLEDGLQGTLAEHVPAPGATAFSPEATRELLDMLRALPTGPVAMSQDIPGLVETSTSLAVVRSRGASVEIACSTRSSTALALRDALDTLKAIGELAGATSEEQDGYPGWKPDLSSKVLGVTRRVYRKLFDGDAVVTAVHAGLECGLIGERIPDIDMVSFGPQIDGAHAPGERVNVVSVAKFWKLLLAVLEELAAAPAADSAHQDKGER